MEHYSFESTNFVVLQLNKFLRELNLSHNHLGSDAGELLGPAIGKNERRISRLL